MGYVENNLMPGERIVHTSRLHWAVLIWPVVGLLLAMLLGSLPQNETRIIWGLVVLASVLWLMVRILNRNAAEFAITNRRVLIKTGILQRHSFELLLGKVEGVGVDQGLLGRILGYGTLVITGTGGTKERFDHITGPLAFRAQVHGQIKAT